MSFKKNTFWGIAGGAIPALSALISVPVLVQYLGYERFAITSLLLSLVIFFYIYDFGVGRALTYFFPRNENSVSTNHLLFSGLYLAASLGALITAVAYFSAPVFVSEWMSISPGLVNASSAAFQILALGIFPSVVANAFRGALEGISKFKKANAGKIFSGASIFIAPALLVVSGTKELESISTVVVLTRYMAMFFFGFMWVQAVPLKFIGPNFPEIIKILHYTKWAAIGGFISTMFVYGDRFIVSRYLDTESLAVYIFSQDILIRFLLIPWAMSVVLMPYFVARKTSKEELLKFYLEKHKIIRNYSLLVGVFIILGVYIFLTLPTGFKLSNFLFEVVVIQTFGIFFCAISQLPLIYLYAEGKPKAISLIYLFEAMLYLVLAPMIFKAYGLTGACLVWSSRLFLEYIFLSFYTKSTMKHAAH